MLFSVLGSVGVVQAAEWKAGDSVMVSVDENVLTVSGTGDVYNYTASSLPDWNANNGAITQIVIKAGVTSIGDFAFSSFMNVNTVTIADTVTRIGTRAFSGCMLLKSVFIPKSVRELGECALSTNVGSISSLEEITVDSQNKYFTVDDGILYNSVKTVLYKIPSKAQTDVLTIPSGVVSIRDEAAAGCAALTEVYLPETVEAVGRNAFENCVNLVKVVVNNRDCDLGLGSVPNNQGLKLYGYKGSNVELYAQNNGYSNIEFIALNEGECTNHIWNNGEVKTPATAQSDGEMVYTCQNCGATKTETIAQISSAVLSKTSYTYDGNEKNPTVKITDVVGNVLKKDVDYTLTYDEGRTDVGTYNVNIAYKGNYSGTDTVSFKVIHQIPERCTPKLSETTYVYDGTQKTPTVSITDVVDNVLKEGTDYTLTYDVGRTEPGTYNVNITYKGNYSGTDTLRFRIIDPSTEKLTASLSKTSYTYDGNEKNPTVTIKDAQGNVLTKDVDYTLSYDAGRTDVGTYNVEITYKGYYTGSETLNFVIKPQIPERCTPKLSKTSYTYDGNEKNPTVTIKDVVNNVLVEGRDYTLAYDSGRTNAGTYNVKITYKGNYSGTDTVSFKVIRQIPSRCTATLSTTATYYNGSVKTPGVTVKDVVNNTLKNGRDYTVTMDAGRKNVGRYAVKITYKGNYSGSQTLYFNIIPRGITNIKSVSARSKGFTVQWPTQTTQTTGYQIQYSTSSSFSNAKTITMPKSTYYAKKVTGLTANKRYYVRIRTYKTTKFNGKNYNVYSFWCATKSVVTKR